MATEYDRETPGVIDETQGSRKLSAPLLVRGGRLLGPQIVVAICYHRPILTRAADKPDVPSASVPMFD
jgi:hypothetical protein